MTAADATATGRIFEHDRVAGGYATARPYLHPQVFARVRKLISLEARVRQALDVGCGTGMSSVALAALARDVVGTDASLPMLRRARRAPHVRYVASSAEALPFRAASFDLVLACGSIDWVDRTLFLPRAFELLTAGGWLVALDFGDSGRSPDLAGLGQWYDQTFQTLYPRPGASDPTIGAAEATRCGFEAPSRSDFSVECPFTATEYAAFLTTESNVIAAVEYGTAAAETVRARLDAELVPLFGDGRRRVTFAGYVQALRRP